MAQRSSEKQHQIVQQYTSNFAKPANPANDVEGLIHNSEYATKQAIRSAYFNTKKIEFGQRPAKVVFCKTVAAPSDYGYFSSTADSDTEDGYYSVLCFVPDHDASLTDAIKQVENFKACCISDLIKMKLLTKFYISIIPGGLDEPIPGDIVLVDYHDKRQRKNGFIVEVLKESNTTDSDSPVASDDCSSSSSSSRDLMNSADADFTGPTTAEDPIPVPDESGYESTDLDDLEPNFRALLETVMARTADKGYVFNIRVTYRDQKKQQYMVDQGWSSTLRSQHNNVDENNQPASMAVDFDLPAGIEKHYGPNNMSREEADAWIALRDAAKDVGLRTGATYKKQWRQGDWVPSPKTASSKRANVDTPGAKWGIGWDPGHIEYNPPRRVTPGRDEEQSQQVASTGESTTQTG